MLVLGTGMVVVDDPATAVLLWEVLVATVTGCATCFVTAART